MKVEYKNFQRFLKERDIQFIIPVYQRNYEWKISHCKQLFDDIIKASSLSKEKSHFIGSIVFITNTEYQSASIKELVIIDGQQRITTFTLLWLAILEKAKEFKNEKLVKTIAKYYIINEDFYDKEKLKLRPTANNNEILKGIIKEGKNFEHDEFSNIIENYNYFLKVINKENFNSLTKGIGKLFFAEISLKKKVDDPQQIFESLNATGLNLSEADKIRNYILIDLEQKKQENFYNNYWKVIEKNAKILNTNQNKVDEFIRDYLTLFFKEISNKNKIYQKFKEKFNFQGNEKENELIKLKKYSKHYNKLLNYKEEKDKEISKQLKFINLLEITVSYPFLLGVYQDFKTNVIEKKDFIKILKIIQSFVFRRFILGISTAALNKIFNSLYFDIVKSRQTEIDFIKKLELELISKTRSQRFPNNGEIKTELKYKDLYNIKPKKREYLFLQLENYGHKEPIEITDYTIEHIFPQNPDKEWKLDLKQSEYTKMHEKYINTISNLTLTGYNSKYSNKIFQKKRDMEKGFKESHLFLNRYVASCEKWNIKTLEERFKILYEYFCKIWDFPQIETTNNNTNDEQNIFEISNATGEKVEYILFYKEKIPVKTNKEVLEIVAKKMFNLQPEYFVGTKLGKELKLCRKKDNDKKYSKISDNYFIYTWHSTNNIFKNVKFILKEFGWDNEFFIKFLSKKIVENS